LRVARQERDSTRINLSWLVRLRWGAVAGQLATVAFVSLVMEVRLSLAPLLAVIGFEVVTNALCLGWLRAGRPVKPPLIAAVMALDVLTLTALLFSSGGSYNPFSFLYLVYIALAAVVLQAAWTWALLALASVSSGLLFSGPDFLSAPLNQMSHAEHMEMHLHGMWIAFVVAAVFIVYFVSRVRRALAERERDLEAERAIAARNERLTSLATLAAGAAHELSTPLATIAMAAKELDRVLRARESEADVLEDVGLIRSQIARCRAILDQMTADAGTPRADAPARLRLSELVEATLAGLDSRERIDVVLEPGVSNVELEAPVRALALALRGVTKNACEAAPESTRVTFTVRTLERQLEVEIADVGAGMAPEVLARAGEPFFTTKPTGRGMGLGLFLARSVIERVGGSLELDSQAGVGTRVTARLPAGIVSPERQVA
jgi:two-component system sensor histidine kinase RegB